VTKTISSLIAESLVTIGVKRVYGLPGGEMLDLLEATRKVGIEFILTHHETCAAFMAAAEGRLRREPAACIATLGPGATNLVTGIAHAYLDRCPVVAITAATSISFREDHTHQNLNLVQLFSPITKGSYLLIQDKVSSILEEALSKTITEPFGPTALHVPRDLALEPISNYNAPSISTQVPPNGDLTLRQVAERLNKASKPLIVIGLATPPNTVESINQFIDIYAAPVGVTPKVKGIVDESHPLFTGTYGGLMAESVLSDFMQTRDLVLCLGLDPTEIDIDWPDQERFVWMLPSLNVDRKELPTNTWCGELSRGLSELSALLNSNIVDGEKDAASVRAKVRETLERGIPDMGAGMSPLHVLDILAKIWPSDEAVCCDVGAHKLLIGQCWPASIPNRFFMSNGLSSMGYGIAAPIAINLVTGRPVLSVIGDGGMLM
jgi:acetolactate synthase-1/2/3 large subunit